jgi:mono/diheme cytochrome c family protein
MKAMKLWGVLFAMFFVLVGSIALQSQGGGPRPSPVDKYQNPPGYVPSGKQMYREYCASCHGTDGKGRGPVTPSLRVPPPDLTKLAKRHDGVFPRDYVAGVLRFGPGFAAHGSSEMPVWGPIFLYLDHYDETAVRERIKNLCDFIESIQERAT